MSNQEISSLSMVKAVIEALDDKKGEDISVIDITEISTLADYFIMVSGSNRNHVQTLCDNIEETLGRMGIDKKQCEGYESGNWILLDYRDVVIHIFDKENRLFYDLERIWRDGKQVDITQL